MKFVKSSLIVKLVILILVVYATVTLVHLRAQIRDKDAEVQGLTSSTIDGVSIRAAKFATKNYIPILGGYLADGFDLILASSVLIKNSLGVVVLILLVITIMAPVLKIVVFNLALSFVTAIVEPIAGDRIVGFLSGVGKNLTILLVSILAVAFMLFILIMLIIFSANTFV